MIFVKNNYILILILLLGIFLRINVDTFIPGYNYDEIAIMSVAKQSFPLGILKESAFLDYHAPLYYLITHFFTYFNGEWLYLRLFNILLSVLNIYVFYKIGIQLKDRKTGYILASILAVNHLHISIANFIKFYTLCFLLVSIIFYYLIKAIKYNSNYLKLGIFNALFVLSATFGIIFSCSEYLVLFLSDKFNRKQILKSFLITFVSFLMYLPILLIQSYFALNNIITPHGAYQKFDLYLVYEFLNDYFSPLTDYSFNTATVDVSSFLTDILNSLKHGNIDYFSIFIVIILSFIPVVIFIVLISKNRNKLLYLPLSISGLFAFLFILLVIFQIVGLTPLYLYPFGLILLITAGCAVASIKKTSILIAILTYVLGVQLIIPNSYPIEKRKPEQGQNKIFYCFEKYFNDNTDDRIYIVTAGGRFVQKYYKNKRIFSFDYEQTGFSHNKKFVNLIYGNENVKKINRKNIKEYLEKFIKNNEISSEFERYLVNNLISKVSKNGKITYVFNADTSAFLMNEKEIDFYLKKPYIQQTGGFESIIDDNYLLTQTIISDISTTYCNEQLIRILDKYLKRIKIEQYIDSKDGIYSKTFQAEDFDKSTEWIAKNALNGWIFITYTKE